MAYGLEDQLIALAGLIQSVSAVNDIAHKGKCETAILEASVQSLFATHPKTTLDVYGSTHALQDGLKTLEQILVADGHHPHHEIIRYALGIIHLSGKLQKQPHLLDIIRQRLESAKNQCQHFGPCHDNLIHNLASVYVDTVGSFKTRIQVSGSPRHLTIDQNAAKIRTLLLAGIRAAMLWRQVGGRRWQLLWNRKKMAGLCRDLANQYD